MPMLSFLILSLVCNAQFIIMQFPPLIHAPWFGHPCFREFLKTSYSDIRTSNNSVTNSQHSKMHIGKHYKISDNEQIHLCKI